jgi:hypothetical protein
MCEEPLDNSTAPGAVVDDSSYTISRSIDDASLLVAYAAERGLDIEPTTYQAISAARSQIRANGANSLPAETESAFWEAFDKLSRAIRPATVVSIKASSDHVSRLFESRGIFGPRDKSKARRAVRRYKFIFFFSLFILLVLQLYALLISTVLADFRQLESELLDQEQNEFELQSKIALTDSKLRALRAATPSASAEEAPSNVQNPSAKIEAETRNKNDLIRALEEQFQQMNSEFIDIKEKIAFLQVDLDAKTRLLERIDQHLWNPLSPAVGDVSNPISSPADTDPATASFSSRLSPSITTGQSTSSTDRTSESRPAPSNTSSGNANPFARSENQVAEEASQQLTKEVQQPMAFDAQGFESTAVGNPDEYEVMPYSLRMKEKIAGTILPWSIFLESLNLYVLPLAYGLLGACAYVLRQLSNEVRDMTYTTEMEIGLNLRLFLGALSGLAVAWFLNPTTAPAVAGSIAPLALAFLAGYSVEVVFAAMDNLVSAFSREPGGNTEGPHR